MSQSPQPLASPPPRPTRAQRRETRRWVKAIRAQERNARKRLAGARSVGRGALVVGEPVVEATDLEIGDDFALWSVHRQTFITGWGRLRIGDRCFINSGVVIFTAAAITIGDDVAIANEAYLMDSDSHGVEGRPVREQPITIGAGSWIGARALVLPGVTIGRRCVVAAGAVVSRDVPDCTLVAGNPARVVRELHYPEGVVRAWHNPPG